MPKHAVFLRMKVKPGRADELMAIYDQLFEEFAGQEFCEVYTLHQSERDPNEFWAYELFTTRELFQEHRTTPLVDKLKPQIVELCEEREFIWGLPLRSQGQAI